MDPVSASTLQSLVDAQDVYATRDADGFWTYFSRLQDGTWIVEYDPKLERRDRTFVVKGPFGVRDVLPLEARPDIGRVVVCHLTGEAAEAREVAFMAAHVAVSSLPIRSLEEGQTDRHGYCQGLLYEICDDGIQTGMAGVVEVYQGLPSVWRMEDGTEVLLSDVADRLWPFGSPFPPP